MTHLIDALCFGIGIAAVMCLVVVLYECVADARTPDDADLIHLNMATTMLCASTTASCASF